MTGPLNALDLSYEEWVDVSTRRWGLPRYRADQICQWIYQKKVFDVHAMTNLSKELRQKLLYDLLILPPVLVREETSRDGTKKFLWQLQDGERIETVLLSHGSHATACLSSQVGCPLSCSFCATGQSGFVRNLSAGEIVGQLLAMERRMGVNIENVVYMGMGEPFLNVDALFKSIFILNAPKMRNMGARHITVSTSGVVPGVLALADLSIPVRLSVSLHASNERLRTKLMPVNRQYSLGALMKALKTYQDKTGERITLEYIMIRKENDDPELAYELAALLSGLGVYVNLIPYNPVDGRYERSEPERVRAFADVLTRLGIENEIRREKGTDIDAACGQLRLRAVERQAGTEASGK